MAEEERTESAARADNPEPEASPDEEARSESVIEQARRRILATRARVPTVRFDNLLGRAGIFLSGYVQGAPRVGILSAGVYVLRTVGIIVAIVSPVYPFVQTEIAGALGWLINLVASVFAGFTLLVLAEICASIRDVARSTGSPQR